MTDIISEGGHTLITGEASQWQSNIGLELFAEHLASGGTGIWIVSSQSESMSAERSIADWARARAVNAGRFRLRVVVVHPIRDAAELRGTIEAECTASDWRYAVLVYRDLSGNTLPTLPGTTWLGVANELAREVHASVFTVAHAAHHRVQMPDLRGFKADKVWRCEATNGGRLGAKLSLVKPV